MSENIYFNGTIPCINHRAALKSSNNILNEIITIGKLYSIPMDKLSIYTVFLKQLGYIDRRYTTEELNELDTISDLDCNFFRYDLDLLTLCSSCTLSLNYANSFVVEEETLLRYCLLDTTNRNLISSTIKQRFNKVFASNIRIGNDDTTTTYVRFYLLCYKFLCTLPIIPVLSTNEEFEELSSSFYSYLIKELKISLTHDEQGYIISLFVSLFIDKSKTKYTEKDIIELCKKLLTRSPIPKLTPKNKSHCNKIIDNQISLFEVNENIISFDGNSEDSETSSNNEIDISSNTESDLSAVSIIIDNDVPGSNSTQPEIDETLSIDGNVILDDTYESHEDKHLINMDSICTLKYRTIFDLYITNKLTKTLIDDKLKFTYVKTEEEIISLDYTILTNKIIALEPICIDDQNLCLLYLFKQNKYYILDLTIQSTIDLLRFYLGNTTNITKLVSSSLLLKNILSDYNMSYNKIYSLDLLYQIQLSKDILNIYDVFTLLPPNIKIEFFSIIDIIPLYIDIFTDVIAKLSNDQMKIYYDELLLEDMIACTIFPNKILELENSKQLIEFSSLLNGKRNYIFNLNTIRTYHYKELLINILILNDNISHEVLIDIYKSLCIKLVSKSMHIKYNLKLINLDHLNGIKFIANKSNHADVFTLINRWLVQLLKQYNIVPQLEIESTIL